MRHKHDRRKKNAVFTYRYGVTFRQVFNYINQTPAYRNRYMEIRARYGYNRPFTEDEEKASILLNALFEEAAQMVAFGYIKYPVQHGIQSNISGTLDNTGNNFISYN